METLFALWKIAVGLENEEDDTFYRMAFGAGMMAAASPSLIGASVSEPRFEKMVHDFAYPQSRSSKPDLPS